MSNELIVLEKVELVPFFTEGDSVDSLLAEIEREAMAHVPDVSTAKGRAAIKANITKIVKCKTFLESNGKTLAAEYKAIPKTIDANRKKVKDFLESLQALAREQLTEWEDEQARIKLEAEEKAAADVLQAQVDNDHEIAVLMMAEDFRQREAQAEQARLDQIARDEAIALAAKQEAERVAAYNAEQEAIKAQEAIDKAEAAKQEAITAAKAAEEKAKQDYIDAMAREKQAAIDAENARIAAEDKAKLDAEQAVIDEQNRVAAEQKRIDDETAKREANTKYKGKINREAMKAIMQCGADEDTAKRVINAIYKGFVPNVSINY